VPCLGMKRLETRYKQIQRFFWNFRFDETILARFIASFLWEWPYVLSMDRTNRKYGKVDINILTIGIVYKGIAFPVLRKPLPKRWNSNTEERISLVKKFIEIFWKRSVWLLLADREFVWEKRILWLMENKVEFILRVRNNTKIEWYGKSKHIFHSFKYDKIYEPKTLQKKKEGSRDLALHYMNENKGRIFDSNLPKSSWKCDKRILNEMGNWIVIWMFEK